MTDDPRAPRGRADPVGPAKPADRAARVAAANPQALLVRMRRLLWTPPRERAPAAEPAEPTRTAEVLELSLGVGERLLADGQGAEDVEAAMLAVLHAYGVADADPQVTYTMIAVSRPAGDGTGPVMAGHTVRRRGSDYRRLTEVYRLVADIAAGRAEPGEAHARLDEIRGRRPLYPARLVSVATGMLAASAALLVSGRDDRRGWATFAVAFAAAVLGNQAARLLAARGFPAFYQTAIAAAPAAAAGVILALTDTGLGGSAVVTGSLFALFPGRSLVGAVEDGLTGFYLTAAARLLEVLYLVAGIIVGVLAVLPIGVRLGAVFDPEGGLDTHWNALVQVPAAAVLALSLAVMLHTPPGVLGYVMLGGAIAWAVFDLGAHRAGLNPVVVTGLAACAAGLTGHAASRFRHLSPLPYITGALGPLLPGSLLYTGVLELVQGHAAGGVGDLSRAGATALALALGVSLSGELMRTAHR